MVPFHFYFGLSHSCPISPRRSILLHCVWRLKRRYLGDSIIETRNTEICLYEYVERAFCASGAGFLILAVIELHIGVEFVYGSCGRRIR